MIRRIAINTGGGDAPGLNAVIRAVALSALNRGWDVLGIRHGYEGVLENEPDAIISLDRARVRGIIHLGGTILGTTNRGDPFNYPVEQDGKRAPTDVSDRVVRRFEELEIVLVPLEQVVGGTRAVEVHSDTVDTGRDLGICFGDEPSGTFSNRAVVSGASDPGDP